MGVTVGEKGSQNLTSEEKCTSQHLDRSRSLELVYIQDKLESFRATMMKDVDKRMTIMIDEIIQEMRQNELRSKEFPNFAKYSNYIENNNHNTWNNRVPTTNTGYDNKNGLSSDQPDNQVKDKQTSLRSNSLKKALPEKVFITRESYLTALLQIPHMKSIYHIFYIILLVFLLNTICYDYFVDGKVNFGLGTFKSGLGKLDMVLGALLIENILAIFCYFGVKGWAGVRKALCLQKNLQRFWSYCCLITYISFQLLFYYVALALCLKWNLPFVTASVLLLESTRMVMKIHSFVRVMAARQISGKLKTENGENLKVMIPPLKNYLYFLFAPTLIYRDSYPRTTHIRWKFAINRLLEVVAIAFLYSYIHERHIRVHFANYGLESLTASSLIIKLFGMIMPSVVILLCGFYLILHAWLNFTSELLRFGDRMFYKDWWTSHNYDAYFRNWNVVVHDWLYEYIYKDFYNSIFKNSKLACSIMVFMLSALVHEFILGFALQIFFPVMFLFFGVFGVGFVFLTRKLPKNLGNIFLWFSLIFGNSLMVSLYCMEFYAANNCPKTYHSWLDYLKPALWNNCNN